jgi:hypothetical protein
MEDSQDSGNVIEIRSRLRDGRAVKTDEDYRQWFYEYFDSLSREAGTDHVPYEMFPVITRVMVEWVDAIRGLSSPEFDLETAQCLADAVKHLTDCQKRCIETAVKSIEEGACRPCGRPS